jgi:hypothetical protein
MIRPTAVLLFVTACSSGTSHPTTTSYDELVVLFQEWRAFERPAFTDGVPDYSPAAMTAQRRALADYQDRLGAFDTSAWPVEQQIDHHMVQAELNGLDFDHRVRRPWARNPSFYTTIFTSRSDVPAHEGPIAHGWIDLWTYEYPLSADAAAELAEGIGAIPGVLEQARVNLVEDARDLWVGGIRSMRAQSNDLAGFADRVAGTSADLDAAITAARTATDEFRTWLEDELPSKNGPSGVGKDNYTWYQKPRPPAPRASREPC